MNTPFQPLAARLRPNTIDEYIGQAHLVSAGKPLRQVLESGMLHSMILWGPPGKEFLVVRIRSCARSKQCLAFPCYH